MHEHLRDGRERDRDRQIEHQVEAEIAHGRAAAARRSRPAAAASDSGGQQDRAGRCGRGAASRAGSGTRSGCTFSSVISSRGEVGDDAAVRGRRRRGRSCCELVHLGRVPEEGAAAAPPRRGSWRRPPAWCRCRRRASGRPSARCRRPSRARGRTAPSAGCRRRATGCCCRRRACGCRSARASPRPRLASRARIEQEPARQSRAASRCRCSRRSTRAGRCRRSAGRRRRARPGSPTSRAGLRARPEELDQEHLGLALAAEPGEADDLAAIGDELAPVALAARRGRGRTGAPLARRSSSRAAAARGAVATLPMAATSAVAVESRGRVASATTLPSRITTMRSAVARISPRRCEIRMHAAAAGDEAADEGEELAGEHARRATRSARRG